MAHQIRRYSMEHLELYDLDKLTPPIPPPRKSRCRLRTRSDFDRYEFLCDMNRLKTDPVYAATPMFRTIPQSSQIKHSRQLLGSYLPAEIIKPVLRTSTESESVTTNNDTEEEKEKSDEDADENLDEADDEDEREQSSSSSSSNRSDSDDKEEEDIFDDDEDKKGILEQIFNRGRK
jgi:hypothetical protein